MPVFPKFEAFHLIAHSRVNYTIELDINIETQTGIITFLKQSISTHQDIWKIYKNLSVEDLNLIRLDNFDTEYWDLIDERNKENYSFDGYRQLDFNLLPVSFPGYFNRNEIIETSSILYDGSSGEVLTNFQHLFHIYNDLEIANLPIEISKFEHMINYMLDESIEKEKLLDLCKEGFPLDNKYTNDLNVYYNS